MNGINDVFQAWNLWNEQNIVEFIDPIIRTQNVHDEISRCIHIGLLCVQDLVKDRPTMSAVNSMLNSEIVDLPAPKQPAFTERSKSMEEPSKQNQRACSVNSVTLTRIEGR